MLVELLRVTKLFWDLNINLPKHELHLKSSPSNQHSLLDKDHERTVTSLGLIDVEESPNWKVLSTNKAVIWGKS